MGSKTENKGRFFIDFPARIKSIQAEMAKKNIDVYLGSRLRTLSWTLDAFCPWRSFVVIPAEGLPAAFSFVIDAARIADETWLPEEQVFGFAPMGGQDQIELISDYIKDLLKNGKGSVGIESGMSNYLPEGWLSHYEYQRFNNALEGCELINAHTIIDALSLIKDEGTINRFREASRIVDVGHKAVYEAITNGGWKGMTETEIAGLAALAMRREGSEWEWSFTGGNEIASGYRTGFTGGACTPATRRKLAAGEPLMVDIHAMFMLGLGDHSHNYLIAPVTDRQFWHAKNFTDIVALTLKTYKPGISPSLLADQMMAFAEDRGFSDYMVPGFEHGIGLLGDEWRIGLNNGPFPYWTNPDHVYQENEVLICAMQYACQDDNIGFRYENPIVITKTGCEEMSKFPLSVDEIK
ncbi:MAG TPA: M24 family metallopeptidase [Smithellaceae bacterium]|jgi:Xaa-Pro aminopeptidase|nr:M24 family metallopeptidase [Smithellaceae bacterium]HQF83964.1 M24 family metallopeptidase [Smithellaceae bacterium]HQG80411.1 M24 family metallopeptidase [Smithellaceae bacterium]